MILLLENREYMPWQDINLMFLAKGSNFEDIPEAIVCAKGWFNLLKRKDGRDEFIHAKRTAQIIYYHMERHLTPDLDLFKKREAIGIGSLFHDTNENVHPDLLDYIVERYGEDVGKIVFVLTIRKGVSASEYFKGVAHYLETILIKLADRLHNLRNMTKNIGRSNFFTEKRLRDQVDETKKFIMPMAGKAIKEYPKYKNLIEEMRKELLYSIRDAEYVLGVHI